MPRSTVAANGPIDRPAYRELHGGRLALDFIDTVDRHDAGVLPAYDYFAPGYANLLAWSEYAGVVTLSTTASLQRIARKEGRAAATVRRRAVALREALRAIAFAFVGGTTVPRDALALLDDERRIAESHQRLVERDGRIERLLDGTPELDLLLWPVTLDAIDLFGSPLAARIRSCAAPECGALFLDASKNRSRRFCSTSGCGNTTRVRRFRARLHETGAT